MRFTESLTPSDRADEKKPVGKNFGEVHGTAAAFEIPPELRDPAMRTVAADAQNLLEHLGLIDPLTPKVQWKRANTPKAAA